GATIGGGDPASVRYLLRTLTTAEILKMPRTPDVMENILGRTGVPEATRAEVLTALAKAKNVPPVALLLANLESPAEIDVRGVGRLLLTQPSTALKAYRANLLKLGL